MRKNEDSQIILMLLWLVILAMCSFEAYGRELKTNGDKTVVRDSVLVKQIIISGNKVTKPRVILNELEFKTGDSLLVNRLGHAITRSRDNLLNTSLFNFVSITYSIQADRGVVFHIKVDERWYWWAFPIFEHADRNLSSFLESGDWSRMNYGVYLKRDNFRGRKELLKLRIKLGFSTQIALRFDSPEYKRKTGWGIDLNAKAFNKIPFNTFDNQPIFVTLKDDMAQFLSNASVYYGLRSNLYQRHQITLTHANFSVSDTVVQLNPNYLTPGDNKLQFLSLSYQYNLDKRDSKAYPLKGTSLKLDVTQMGFGILNDDLNDLSLKMRFQQYVEIGRRWHWGGILEGRVGTSDQLPYVLSQGLGYKTFMNGYELYVIDGVNNAMMQNKLMFTLLEPRVKTIGFVPLNQFAKIHYAFYLKTFFDYGYAWQYNPDPTNTMANSWQYGYGIGIDFVTFYDKVFSINYAANKLGQHGIFVHLNLEL